jgi:hypothetical protein
MPQDPKRVDEKVGSYSKPERSGGTGPIVGIILVVVAIILILWLFTDIL